MKARIVILTRFFKKHRYTLLTLSTFCLIGWYLRFETLSKRPLWYDETYTVAVAKNSHSLYEVWKASSQDGGEHPFLYYGLAYLSEQSPFASLEPQGRARLPSLLAGCLSLPLAAILAWQLAGARVSCFATFLLSFSIYQINYAQDARPYALLICLLLCSALSFLWLLQARKPLVPFVAFVISSLGSLYTHHTAIFFHLGIALNLIILILAILTKPSVTLVEGISVRKILLRFGLGYTAVGLAFYPQISNILLYLSTNNLVESHVLALNWHFFSELSERWSVAAGILPEVLLLAAGLGALRSIKFTQFQFVLITWVTIPFLIFGLRPFNKFFDIRFLSVAYPAFLLLASIGVDFVVQLISRLGAQIFKSTEDKQSPLGHSLLAAFMAVVTWAMISNYLDFRALNNRCDDFFQNADLLRINNAICSRQLILNSLNPEQKFILIDSAPIQTAQ